MAHTPKRIFVGIQEISGFYSNLCRGFRKLNVPYRFVTFSPHPYGYDREAERPLLVRCRHWCIQVAMIASMPRILKRVCFLLGNLVVFPWVLYTCLRHDVFIFGFGQSLLHNQWDLRILKFLRKKVIFNLSHGSEARPPYIDGAFHEAVVDSPAAIAQLVHQTQKRLQCVQRIESYSSIIIGSIYTAQFFQKKFVNYLQLGLPFDGSSDLARADASPAICSRDKAVRILHAPSNPTAKGTPFVVEAIENLRRKGYSITYVEVQGRPFSDVFEEIKKADFVVDQIYSDTPMAGFACEAAWYGKPAVVGGYGLQTLQSFIPESLFPPSMLCLPEQIESAIEFLIADVDARERLGRRAQEFVRSQWSCEAVAARYRCLISGDIPEHWMFDPKKVAYVDGCCLSRARGRKNIQAVIEYSGVGGLGVAHRPDMEAALLAVADLRSQTHD